MDRGRRDFLFGCGALALLAMLPACVLHEGEGKMFGLIGKMTAVEGKREELIGILLEGLRDMPGCLSYIVSEDTADPNAIWITEVWESEARHKASLSLPSVQQAIARGKPLIAGFGDRVITRPVGGHGLAAS